MSEGIFNLNSAQKDVILQISNKNYFARAGARTLDVQVKSLTLYQLSYPGSCKNR